MKRVAVLACLLTLLPALAGDAPVDIDRAPDADISKYHTYAWGEGAPIDDELVQAGLIAAVDRELAAHGLKRVDDAAGADLIVATYVFNRVGLDVWSAQANTQHGSILAAQGRAHGEGTLSIKLAEPGSETSVWRATYSKAFQKRPDRKKADKVINKVVQEMFAEFP